MVFPRVIQWGTGPCYSKKKKKKKRKSVDCVVKTLMGKIINLDTNDVPVSFQMVPLSVFDAFCQMSSVTAFGLN